ncbi:MULTISPECIES: cation:proton antiporter [unclassified Paludibacterium]|uniref:cation:proton antiporter n=1 Tax=unclassified Paludibacterium TaxID=2618429 RepID=UPI001C04AA5D|nr:cation:proton antiporter [Paludibacterium sp. B53371]BEV72940.1 hypothetical protein THUN1379_24220 [Paludibacterium sp. THUN1379]
MKRVFWHVLGYGTVLVLSVSLLLWILSQGPQGTPVWLSQAANESDDWLASLQGTLGHNATLPLVGLLMQILIILTFSRLCAFGLRAIGQPPVIGEMLAGILLGKSVFAQLWPQGFHFVFPESAMPQLYFFSQIGLIFFMFVVGLDLRLSSLRQRAGTAIVVSHASILLPFLLGTLLSFWLYRDYGPRHVAFSSFALFIGIAMSITAFPVLARIIHDKGLSGTPVGTLSVACAAVDDVTAWCLLAGVLGIVKAGSLHHAVIVLLASTLYVVLMIKLIRPLAHRLLWPATQSGTFTSAQLAFVFCVGLGSALLAEVIGIHALFGAFLAGVIMPHELTFQTSLSAKIEDLTAVVLLPIFFAYTGIRAEIGLLDSWHAWLVCGGIILVATVGKVLGAALAAHWTGVRWRQSWALGVLMNTRGLMELVVLNIGYDIGILTPTIFAMMVVMALVTTFMTCPLLGLLLPTLQPKTAMRYNPAPERA